MPSPYQRKRPRPELPTPPSAGLDGYRCLIVGILRQACVDARGGPELREDARRWLESEAPAQLLELVGLEPDFVLPKVRQSLGPG